ncbi:MAG: DEAD/DEAH box helicase [Planctomycetota bacterium]
MSDAVSAALHSRVATADGPIELHPEFLNALRHIETDGPPVFITGPAGTGKSTLVHYLRETLEKNLAIVAPTGVAALNVGGETIHAFFRFPPHPPDPGNIRHVRDRSRYQNLEVLVVDEVSMVRADLLDAMEKFLRVNGPRPDRPFGGVRMVFVGDLHQLPPVVTRDEESLLRERGYPGPYFHMARSLPAGTLVTCELTRVFRQEEAHFIRLLHRIRAGTDCDEALAEINRACVRDDPLPDSHVTLTATNAAADRINQTCMARLPGPEIVFEGALSPGFPLDGPRLPSPRRLELRPGAQVMFTRNDPAGRWVNGSLGTVRDAAGDRVRVRVISGARKRTLSVERVTWEACSHAWDPEAKRLKTEVRGTYHQFPLMPAWAVTIHKAQGKTLDHVLIDLGHGAFAHGQVYVALSRCRSLDNIRLRRPLRVWDVIVDPGVREFREGREANPADGPRKAGAGH